MASTRTTQSTLVLAALLCSIALLLTALPASVSAPIRAGFRDALRPGHRLLGRVESSAAALWRRWTGSARDAGRLADLRAELRARELRCRRLEIANGRLREKIGRIEKRGLSPYRAVATEPLVVPELLQARVLGRETASRWRAGTLIDAGFSAGVRESTVVLEAGGPMLDQGEPSGLQAGQPVYSGRSVVGKVAAVGRFTSTIRPVTDPGFRGMAQLARRTEDGLRFGPTAVLEGCGEPLCRLRYVPATEPVSVGDEVYTAERETALPYPMYCGTVVRAELSPGAAHWEIRVEPAVARVEGPTVQVLRRKLNPFRRLAE